MMLSKDIAALAAAVCCFVSHGVHGLEIRQDVPSDGHWIDTWTAMPQLTEPANLPQPPYNGTNVVFDDTTLRQTLRLTVPSTRLRLRISNAFGTTPLPISSLTIARPYNDLAGVSAIQPTTLKPVTFNGGTSSFTIPNGALAISDPIDFPVDAAGTIVSVSMYLAQGQMGGAITSHPGSRTTSWMTVGNQVNEANLTGEVLQSVAHWYFLSAVEAWVPSEASTLVIIGDSITDGRGSTTDANNRWPDLLFTRLQSSPSTSNIAIANQAAGGNRILADGLGPSALSRLDRDLLSHSGVRYAMIFEGVNDIGSAPADPATQSRIHDSLLAAYQQMISRVHAVGIPVFGATITPFSAPPGSTVQPYSDAGGIREQTRQKINDWIRNSGMFDAVVDFDAILRDPSEPSRLFPAFDSGDFLHPSVAGYQALADAFPVDLFANFQRGVSGFV